MNNRFKVLGINDDRDFCEICGKVELKKVVWLEDKETGEIFHAGVNCAAKKMSVKATEIKKEINAFTKEQKIKARMTYMNSPEMKEHDDIINFLNENKIYDHVLRFEKLNPVIEKLNALKKSIQKEYSIEFF